MTVFPSACLWIDRVSRPGSSICDLSAVVFEDVDVYFVGIVEEQVIETTKFGHDAYSMVSAEGGKAGDAIAMLVEDIDFVAVVVSERVVEEVHDGLTMLRIPIGVYLRVLLQNLSCAALRPSINK